MKRIMTPYSRISYKLIQPFHLYPYGEARTYFLNHFNNDERSFLFLQYLYRYCCEKNQGRWPRIITPETLKEIYKNTEIPMSLEDTQIFKDGYIFKTENDYELTHEFIVSSYLSCGDGNFVPLSTGHIDFTQEEKLSVFMQEQLFIGEDQAVIFLIKLLVDCSKDPGTLMSRKLNLKKLLNVAVENNLIPELCIGWADAHHLITVEADMSVSCDTLFFSAYLASPKLD